MKNLTVLIKPASDLCNMRCEYCFYRGAAKRRKIDGCGIMSPKTLENLVRKAFDFAEEGCSFCFQGGEPTLAGLSFYQEFDGLLKKYNTRKIPVFKAMQTNGYLIDKHWARYLHDRNFLVGLSLDGTEDLHDRFRRGSDGRGTFSDVMRAAAVMNEYRVRYNILSVITDNNACRGKEIYSFFKKRGFMYLQFIKCIDSSQDGQKKSFLAPLNWGRFMNEVFDEYYRDFLAGTPVSIREFDNFISLLLGYPPEQCGMSGVCSGYLTVESDGSIYPCDFYVNDAWRMGNINQNSIDELLNSIELKKFIEISIQRDSECLKCKWLKLCRGGCRRYRDTSGNGELNLNKFCEGYKLFFEHSYDKMAHMALLLSGRRP